MYNIVSCAGFCGTGSGVVTDYLMEFSGIFNPGDFEFRFLQDYGGITTLEDCLVHSYHRLNSDIAIQIFIKYINYQSGDIFNRRYEKHFKGQFRKASYKFLEKLIDIQWKGYWEEYQVLAPYQLFSIIKYKIYPRILKLLQGNRYYIARYIPRRDMYFSNPSSEYFIKCVKEYMNDLCTVVDPENQFKYLYFDQLLPPANIERYFKYFDNLHVVVVDRDPRDLFVDNILNWNEPCIPSDVDKFIVWYKKTREKICDEPDNPNILRLRFEDTIYKYDEFTAKINRFLSLNTVNHVAPKSNFDPDKSIKNTKLWETFKFDRNALKKIEDSLGNYCYQYV